MGSEVIIVPIIFGIFFGIVYLFFSTRNKERMALIEKGIGAEIFNKGKQRTAPIWKVFILNLAVLLMGIGIGVFIAMLLDQYTNLGEGIYPAVIFTTAGAGLFVGFNLTKNLDKE
ncbi:MAG: hypothetical protein BM563_04440 [Bacteroidetes bacterium MedPE-SWsnd-G1]|uniref:DUF6249 domain-containing protein n=1 Tax=Urechidicola vernalis TaxID=3075600 RepID=A0ABU2Y4H1_9FLAO|nr:DUF6249 domain-containing protein [Urechidicola sp. P050]MDT0552716.1 DUF6249 domain-containing protein [Urechidicola sp. P050]OIQ39391.1 MAG: hypothetical protein BM563_04440 [Bacteroidetes bacterium MedPE-SWsnd-G1]